MDDDDAMGNQLTPRNKLDGLLLASDEEEVDDLLGFANFEWDEIQFDGASRVEEVVQEDSTGRGGDDDDNNSAINDDNAFDYEEPERASPTRNVAASDDNSADEYHPSNFKSPSDSDEYEPSDE
ncbi:hypothetical protein PC129_g23178 [Phytophthora cactorum]|uniref:Uncharacterized protein n=1 Tax=Phytophthora cactorum TaxID=29920 RepID=A0A8T0Y4F4_9STRA|nr:hypothetical protein Pcac1_g19233 [Phytophthora cactorum]KAG2792679.1 hypothetical protein PC111_g23359 [Phytophthora cactorum]KAG2792960.1 hypothetical protein PC112_g23649 [Phytophthora cactorum]KAG2820581.1 hypothetical protein PC113_g22581 [Phytophthora cactorum]KAG2880421.1 hypothetical protein PC115_g22512 [Phytophthora cactorum]